VNLGSILLKVHHFTECPALKDHPYQLEILYTTQGQETTNDKCQYKQINV